MQIRELFHSLQVRIIDRYIIRRFLGTFLFAIALFVVVLVVFDAAEKVDDFLDGHAPWAEILTGYYLNFVPYFINQFSALFTFIAVIFFTSKMAYNTEIIATLSAGVSFKRLMWPYFLSALSITALSLFLNLVLIPEANTRRIAFQMKYMEKYKKSNYDPHIYRQVEPGTFVYIRSFQEQSKTADYFALETYDGGTIVSSLEASQARFDTATGHWTAQKWIERRYEGEREILIKHEERLDTAINLVADELGRTEDLIQTMNSFRLRRFIKQQKAKGSDMVSVFQVEAYSRLAYPVSTFILTLIGVSLSSRKVRGGTGLHMGVGIALCFSYIVLMRFTGEFAKGGSMPPWLAVWLPNMIYTVVGVYLYRKAPK